MHLRLVARTVSRLGLVALLALPLIASLGKA